MNGTNLFKIALRALDNNKFRTFLTMKKYTIAFFDTKPYDEASFNQANEAFNYEIKYFKGHLNKNNVILTKDADAVCIFVNDIADTEIIDAMAQYGVKLLALRCAGFNNVDLATAHAYWR